MLVCLFKCCTSQMRSWKVCLSKLSNLLAQKIVLIILHGCDLAVNIGNTDLAVNIGNTNFASFFFRSFSPSITGVRVSHLERVMFKFNAFVRTHLTNEALKTVFQGRVKFKFNAFVHAFDQEALKSVFQACASCSWVGPHHNIWSVLQQSLDDYYLFIYLLLINGGFVLSFDHPDEYCPQVLSLSFFFLFFLRDEVDWVRIRS